MLRTLWNDFLTAYENILGTGSILVLFVVMLGFIVYRRSKEGKDLEIVPSLLVIPGIIAAGLIGLMKEILQINCDSKAKKNGIRMFGLVLCAFVIMISGDRILSPSFYEYADNNMHIPEGLMETMEVILADCDGEIPVLVAPGYSEYFDAYSSRFVLAYNEPVLGDVSAYDEEDRNAYIELSDNHPDMKKVSDSAKENGCKYIVLVTEGYWSDVPLSEFSYELWCQNGGFDIYKIKEDASL